MKKFVGVWVAIVGLALPRLAYACPLCFSSQNKEYRMAYLFTAIFMTLLPLGLVGALLTWVMRRADGADATDAHPLSPQGRSVAERAPLSGPAE